MLYTAFYGCVLAGQESSLLLRVLAATHGWGHGASSERTGRCGYSRNLQRTIGKPWEDCSKGVADGKCSMRWGGKGLIRKRTREAQSCWREVLLETRAALQRLLQPRKPAEVASWVVQGLKVTSHPVRTQCAAGELAFTLRIFISPQTRKPQFSVFQKQLWFCFYSNKTMLGDRKSFWCGCYADCKMGREVHSEALTDVWEPITSRKPSDMFACSLLEQCCNGKKFPREPKWWFQPAHTSSCTLCTLSSFLV